MAGTSGASNSPPGGVAGQQSDPSQAANGGFDLSGALNQQGEEATDNQAEEALVRKLWKCYNDARQFDENFRKQVAIDRRYAAGTSDLSWAVTTNLIGAFIDILVALLYARDPDVSVKRATQVENPSQDTSPQPNTQAQEMEAFAKTLQIIISYLWRKGKLKKAARKGVRSVLSNAEGWFKAMMVSEKKPAPEVEAALNDAQETHARILAQQKLIEDPQGQDPEALEAQRAEKAALIEELEGKLELAVNTMFVIDYVPTENMQVSTDVASISDYLDADWVGNELYIDKEDALTRFPKLTVEDTKSAKIYYQRAPKEMTTRDIDNVLPQGMLTAESAQAFTTSTSDQESPAFLRVVEIWDRRDKQIRTIIDGVKLWAKAPFEPPYPSSRFYPYFYFAFYEVDGSRHAQSLSWRLYKLQDEYSATRSNFRITRERSIPGVMFNATMLDQEEARKLSESKHQEYTGIKPSDPATPLANCFAPKPVQSIDPRLFDPSYILSDMERISGVQEALSAATAGPGNPKTATEANIQQTGTNARTTSDRDSIEWMLTDMAQYTAEQGLQCLDVKAAMRIAGPHAFWPAGMDIDDLFTMAEISIKAGTTGKPLAQSDQQAWATILPLIRQMIGDIEKALATGNLPMANALIELIRETMVRLGDDDDIERFVPKTPPPGSPGAGAPPAPVMPQISVSLKGELSPQAAAQLVNPALNADQAAVPAAPKPGAGLPPGAAPGAPPGTGAVGPSGP